MTKKSISVSFSVHLEEDKDILEILEAHKENKSEFIRQAIRYYSGLLAKEDSEKIDKALYRVIKLEKELKEILTEFRKFKEFIDSKLSEFNRTFERYQRELEWLKIVQERQRKKKEEEKKIKVLEDVKRELKEAVNYFERAGSKVLAFHQIKKMIKDTVEKHGISEEELWNYCFSLSPRLKQQAEIEVRRCYR